MNRQEIMDSIKSLSESQGFYSRLYQGLKEMEPDRFNEVMNHLESLKFNSIVDFILYLEA